MAGGGSPRQKMIGMMYLVLTALLALNVSKSILDSFVIVNEGLEKTTENFGLKNEKAYEAFASLMKDPKQSEKAKPYNELALKTRKLAKELVEYIDVMKVMAIQETDKLEKAVADTITLHYVSSKDNYDVPAQVLLGDEMSNNGRGKDGEHTMKELKDKLNNLKKEFSDIFEKNPKLFLPTIPKELKLKLEGDIHTEDPKPVSGMAQETWEMEKVLHVPLAAVITNLTAMQADIRNAESDVLTALLNSVNASDFKFDKLVAKVIAPSSYLITGQEYKADVLLVAFNSTSNPEIVIGPCDTAHSDENKDPMRGAGKPLEVVGGLGRYKASTGAEGLQKWSGCIKVPNPTGGYKYYPFASEYMVAKPALTVSADKMNVFYQGVDNPITLSAPGIALSDLAPSIAGTNASITPTAEKGKYIVKVGGGNEATINVSAKMGKDTRPMGAAKFRVKRLPDPVAMVAGLKEGGVKKSALAAAPFVIAKYENFDFDLKVNVYEFTVTVNIAGEFKSVKSTGNQFSSEQKSLIEKLKNNGRLIIEDIKCKLPDGTTRPLPSVTLKIQT
jgi:gliding motility-associated protein GldM